jgi:hypothetical protein
LLTFSGTPETGKLFSGKPFSGKPLFEIWVIQKPLGSADYTLARKSSMDSLMIII